MLTVLFWVGYALTSSALLAACSRSSRFRATTPALAVAGTLCLLAVLAAG